MFSKIYLIQDLQNYTDLHKTLMFGMQAMIGLEEELTGLYRELDRVITESMILDRIDEFKRIKTIINEYKMKLLEMTIQTKHYYDAAQEERDPAFSNIVAAFTRRLFDVSEKRKQYSALLDDFELAPAQEKREDCENIQTI